MFTFPKALSNGVAFLLIGMVSSALGQASVRSFMVIEHNTGKVVAASQPELRLPIGSLTKIATACVVKDWAAGTNTDLNQPIIVPPSAATIGGANPMNMMPGDTISLRDALYAALMASDNLCAESLASHVGMDLLRRRGREGDPVKTFVVEMNALAAKLKMGQTKFENPHGLDHQDRPYSTAADICKLSQYAINQAAFMFFVSQDKRRVSFQRQGRENNFELTNTNQLVGRNRVDGLKTGTTRAAGPCIALTADRANRVIELPDGNKMIQQQRLIVVVLGAQDRFGVASSLLQQGWRQFDAWDRAGRNAGEKSFIQEF